MKFKTKAFAVLIFFFIGTGCNLKKEVLISLYEIKKLKALTFSFSSTECKDKLIGAAVYTSRDSNQFFQKYKCILKILQFTLSF